MANEVECHFMCLLAILICFLSKIFIQIFSPFVIGLFILLLLSLENYLHNLETVFYHNVCDWLKVLPVCGSLFIL